MSQSTHAPPLARTQVIDRYFLEHRAKLLDIAAFLDRVDRAKPESQPGSSEGEDFRLDAFRTALKILSDANPHRTKRILETFSDPTDTPAAAADGKGATGAYSQPASKQSYPTEDSRNSP